MKQEEFIYADLSYKIIGILYDVCNDLGFGHKEKIYQKALEKAFKDSKLSFIREAPTKINYRGKPVGIYYFDFLIEDKIILETKVRDYFSAKDIDQLYSYLKAKGLKLGIIAHFTKSGARIKRVVNIV